MARLLSNNPEILSSASLHPHRPPQAAYYKKIKAKAPQKSKGVTSFVVFKMIIVSPCLVLC
jgi:hypothetical protein